MAFVEPLMTTLVIMLLLLNVLCGLVLAVTVMVNRYIGRLADEIAQCRRDYAKAILRADTKEEDRLEAKADALVLTANKTERFFGRIAVVGNLMFGEPNKGDGNE